MHQRDPILVLIQLQTKPVDFKPMIDPKGETATIEVKIKTLTSQHEDSFFKAKIVGRAFSS